MPHLRLPPGAASLAEAVVDAVRDGITTGELVPEKTYSVYQLAEVLAVSRSPVREGLLRLAEAGLVEIHRNRGFRVLRPQATDVEQIFEIRLALEPAAARRAAERGTAEDHSALRRLRDATDDAARTGDATAFWPLDRELHDRLLRVAGNPRAAGIVDQLRSVTALLGPPSTAGGRSLAEIAAEHGEVVDAVLARAGDDAEAAMRAHLERTAALLIQGMDGA